VERKCTVPLLDSPDHQPASHAPRLSSKSYWIYLAPEILQGAQADARSDIFSLGCVLYEMVTGHRAFEGKSPLSVFTAILEKEPEPVTAMQPLTPPIVDRVIRACLAKDPAGRIQTAHDVVMSLRWAADAAPGVIAKSPPQFNKAWAEFGSAVYMRRIIHEHRIDSHGGSARWSGKSVGCAGSQKAVRVPAHRR